MSDPPVDPWMDANRNALRAALGEVQALLVRYVESTLGAPVQDDLRQPDLVAQARPEPDAETAEELGGENDGRLPALDMICAAFGLSDFERRVLLLCAGVELDATFGPLCAAAHDDPTMTYPTFGLAMALLPSPEWSALAPTGPLRRWRLVELGEGYGLTRRPLRIDERLLHYLVGLPYADESLLDLVEAVDADGEIDLTPSHAALAQRVVAVWARAEAGDRPPAIQLCGDDSPSKRAIAQGACREAGIGLLPIRAHSLPVEPVALGRVMAAVERQTLLGGYAFYLDCDELDAADPPRDTALARLIDRFAGFLIVASRQRSAPRQRVIVPLDVDGPTSAEQAAAWRRLLGRQRGASRRDVADALSGQFDLSAPTIRALFQGVTSDRPAEQTGRRRAREALAEELWDAARAQARPRLDQLAQRIEPRAAWDDLVLPEQQVEGLREICMHVRHRTTVYDEWGFAGRSARGLGITALFSGSSGTGKTMAAEVLANELRLDLYRIDLSATVSKYIGETEKNLRQIFDAADVGGAILLFDEADALFGKRSEVKDSHDRYANIEVSYLLQRFEAYRGLAILTTNMKDALDRAFLRRLRFVVEFPFPGLSERTRIWSRIFPAAVPKEDLDLDQLARFNVAGGNIRNIAMNAAFLAVDAEEPVRMGHVLRAARSELAKLEKPLAGAEVRIRA